MSRNVKLLLVLALAVAAAFGLYQRARHKKEAARTVRCAVIGGMTMTGLWPEIAKLFEAETGYRVQVGCDRPAPHS